MKILRALGTIFIVIVFGARVSAAEQAEPSFALPEEYAKNYAVASDLVSPDGRFAFIFPK